MTFAFNAAAPANILEPMAIGLPTNKYDNLAAVAI